MSNASLAQQILLRGVMTPTLLPVRPGLHSTDVGTSLSVSLSLSLSSLSLSLSLVGSSEGHTVTCPRPKNTKRFCKQQSRYPCASTAFWMCYDEEDWRPQVGSLRNKRIAEHGGMTGWCTSALSTCVRKMNKGFQRKLFIVGDRYLKELEVQEEKGPTGYTTNHDNLRWCWGALNWRFWWTIVIVRVV